MTATNYIQLLKACTELEIAALRSAYESSEGNGHDFGFSDDIVIPGKSKQVVGGVISSLLKKNLLTRCDDEFGQIWFATDHYSAPDGTLGKHEAADLVAAFLKGLDAPSPSPGDRHRAKNTEARKAARKARRAARKAAKALLS